MWAQIERIMSEATGRIVTSVAAFMPGVLALLTIMIVAGVLAMIGRQIVLKALQGLEFDRRASQWGLSPFAEWSPTKSVTTVVARGVQWTILVLGLLVGLTALDAAMPSRFALSVFDYLPHVVAALIVLVIGSIVAQFFSRAVLIGAVNMRIHSARALSLAVKWMLLIVSASMALEQLGIGRQILLLAFGILFGGVVLATALAVGLGAKDAVGRAIERQLQAPTKTGDRIDHV
jgi:Mechanosensitive ion channel, conserved TM helix